MGLVIIIQLVSYVISLIEILLRGKAVDADGDGVDDTKQNRRLLQTQNVNLASDWINTGSIRSFWNLFDGKRKLDEADQFPLSVEDSQQVTQLNETRAASSKRL